MLLCYPPPNSRMALDVISQFKGTYFALVGEFAGDTGTQEFEKVLNDDWELLENIELPNFGNTCYTLTMWKRSRLIAEWPLKCAGCGDSFN